MNDSVIKQIVQTLFPPIKKMREDNVTHYVDHSIDANLLAILEDIKNGIADEACIETLNAQIKKLCEIRKLLESHIEENAIDEVGYYIVGL